MEMLEWMLKKAGKRQRPVQTSAKGENWNEGRQCKRTSGRMRDISKAVLLLYLRTVFQHVPYLSPW